MAGIFNSIFKFLIVAPYKLLSLEIAYVFILILKASLYGTIAGAALISVKRVLYKRISAGWQYLLWFILIAKLLVPFGPQAPFSVFNAMPGQAAAISEWSSRPIPNNASDNSVFTDVPDTKETTLTPVAAEPSKTLLERIYTILPYVWFSGMLVMLLWFVYANTALRRKIKKFSIPASLRLSGIYKKCGEQAGLHSRIEVITQNIIKSPALFGFLHPCILLPCDIEDLEDKHIEYIFLHEISHYKRMDNMMNYLLIAIQAVHWFNPFIWLCFKQIRRDMEMATDERALRYITSEEHRDYAESLLNMAESISQRLSPRLLCVIDDKKDMERRIIMIRLANALSLRKKLITAVSIVVMAIAGMLFLTSGIKAAPNDETAVQTELSAYDLEAIAKFETPYVGAASNVGNILDLLPPLSEFHNQRFFSLDTDQPPYGLTAYYEYNDNDEGNVNPFMTSDAENNALVLFTYIGNLEHVTFSFRDDASVGTLDESKYTPRFSYARSDFIQKYGDIGALKNNPSELLRLINDNHFIMPERMHYNRITLGDSLEHIEYRNGEPGEIINNNDGSQAVIYKNLGEVFSIQENAIVVPGDYVTFYLYPNPESGIYKISIVGDSEILMNLNIEDGTYDETIRKLGSPAETEITESGATIISYLLKGTDNQYVYFIFMNETLIEHGLDTHLDANAAKLIKALESALEDGLRMFDKIDNADVSLLVDSGKKTANIVLTTNDTLSGTEVNSIALFISKSVENLNEENIRITDQHSNVIFPVK